MENLKLRQVHNEDWKTLAMLEKKASSDVFHALSDEKEIKEYIEDSEVFFIVLDDEKIGTISYENKENNIHFNGLTVLNEHRRKGIASWAIKAILEKMSDNKKTINLVVHPQNTPAILVYLKAGFKIDGWKDNYFGDGEPRLSLVKNEL